MDANDFDVIECPNCGGTDFKEISPTRHRCTYCGTTLTLREVEEAPAMVRCFNCGQENERGARYCSRCGKALSGWVTDLFKNTDPGLLSILVTMVGTFVIPIPFVSAIAGLALGYKALRSAREGGGNSEKLAKWAVIIGWGALAYSILPLFFFLGISGIQATFGACERLSDGLLNVLSGVGR